MAKRRTSTIARDNAIHAMHKEISESLGDLKSVVSKTYVYECIKSRTKLSIRTISFILNHTKEDSAESC